MVFEQSRPPIDTAHAGLRRVSAVGQVTIPAPVLRRWDMQDGGHINAFDLEEGILFDRGDLEPPECHYRIQELGRYTISRVGQVTLPAVARNRWGLRNGGNVDFLDLHSSILFFQRGGATELLRSMAPSRDDLAVAVSSKA